MGDLGRGVRGRRLRRRARQHRVAAGDVRAHDSALHVQQVVRDDRAAPRLRRDQGRGDPRPREEGALLHGEQRRVGRAVRRHRRARRVAGLHRGVPRPSCGRGAISSTAASASSPATSSRASRRRARSTRSCTSTRRGRRRRQSPRRVAVVADGGVPDQARPDRLRARRRLRRERRGLRALLLRARPQGARRARCSR